MVNGCIDEVGYICLKDKDGQKTIKEKHPQPGQTVALQKVLVITSEPQNSSNDPKGNWLIYGTVVKIIEIYPSNPDLAIVRVIKQGSLVNPYK